MSMRESYDYVIIGAGIYGLYAALTAHQRGLRVAIIEKSDVSFTGASFVNQARLHHGYHYPRSVSTAMTTMRYFERFAREFEFAVQKDIEKVYAIASIHSLTNAVAFEKFCAHVGIPVSAIDPARFFLPQTIEAAYQVKEYTFDAELLKRYFMQQMEKAGIDTFFCNSIATVDRESEAFDLTLAAGEKIRAKQVLNATYAGLNSVISKFGFEPLSIKYEFCEVILCGVPSRYQNTGVTVMDGPFFSLMPFGVSGQHSLTSVTYTPMRTLSESELETVKSSEASQWGSMSQLARKYLNPEFSFEYARSLYTVKPTLIATEIDDARPTIAIHHSKNPGFTSVLSGKISGIFDLEEIL